MYILYYRKMVTTKAGTKSGYIHSRY